MQQRTLAIAHMSCGHCVGRVSKALSSLPGLTVEDVAIGKARVSFDPDQTTMARIGQVLDEAGFELVDEDGAS